MKGWTYILECSDKSLYVGSTNDINRRMYEHQHGLGGDYTSKRLPVKLLKTFEFNTVQEAFHFEHQIKKWNRKKKEALINEEFDLLPLLSKKIFKK